MKYQDIKRLVKLVEASDIDRIEIEEETFRISIEKNTSAVLPPPPVQEHHYTVPAQSVSPAPAEPVASETVVSADQPGHQVLSPMVGTFYRAPAPDSDPFVKEGDAVTAGQTICIIEAMKVMNEIEADVAGVVRSVLVENGHAVQFDDPLFVIEPR